MLNATGERMMIEDYKSTVEDYIIYIMHLASYRWAEPYVRGKRVLDFGCGSGYGSNLLAGLAAAVEAVDVAEDAVVYATRHFDRGNLRFRRIDPSKNLPFADNSFDTVISFQVIEHVNDARRYIGEAFRVLVPGGRLLLITPNRSYRLFAWQRPWNRWHVTEFADADLAALLPSRFSHVEMLSMSGRGDVIAPELRRCRKLKWMSVPFTLPIYPDRLRIRMLNMVHQLRSAPQGARQKLNFDFDESAIQIGPRLRPCIGLVAVAQR